MNNFPCSGCEHLENDHYHLGKAPQFCQRCFYEYATSTKWQHVYKPDNLKYIEQQYEQQQITL